MLYHYLRVASRALRKQAGYALLNVGGLGLGLACCFLIVLFVGHELAFDRFHEKGERVYRLLVNWDEADGGTSAATAAGFAQHLPAQVPEVEAAVRVENQRRPYFRVGGETRQVEKTMALADAAFFDVFSFRLLRGDPATVLDDPGHLVVTESGARALFGDADPMGQTVVLPRRSDGDGGGDLTFTVAGVMEDVPAHTSFSFDFLAPFALVTEFMGDDALENYTNYNFATYFLLRPGADAEAAAATMNALERARRIADGGDDGDGDGEARPPLALQPLHAVHFDTSVGFGSDGVRDVRYLYLFGAVGLLVLLIACVNFMNLATARATKRAKEVGVRKAIGAQQGQLVGQFLGESVLLSAFAILIALVLAAFALPVFNGAMGTEIGLLDGGVGTLALLVGLGLLAGVLAGSYPAFYLSAFRPAAVLRGEVTRGQSAAFLRRGLIVGQFVVSVFLIVATLTVYRQLGYMQAQDLGFDQEHVVFLQPPGSIWDQYDAFKARLQEDPRVLSVAQAGGLPGRVGTSRGYNWPGADAAATDDAEQGGSFWTIPADPDYVDALGLALVAGRTFSWEIPTDTLDTYVLNEAAVRQLGWTPEEAVGQPFRAWDRPMGTVIGVAEDFHFQSLHQPIEPLVLNYIPWFGNVALRLAPGALPDALDHVRATWAQFAPGYVFDYRFLDEDFGRQYEAEQKLGRLFGFFATIAIFIACLGLFGLAAYAAERRTKEIGVRKVLGATSRDVVLLLSREFTVLVVLAFVVAAPLAFFAMHRWLESFAYRVELGVGVFLLAGLIALAIGFATVGTQALRAASTDPVKALRYE